MRVYYTEPELSSGKQRPHPADPTLISQRMLCFPRRNAQAKKLSLYAGFSHLAANTRLWQAATAASRTDSDISANAVFSERFCALNSWVLLQQRYGRSLCHIRKEELRESWFLFVFAFPGSIFAFWVETAKAREDTASTRQQRAWPRMALYAHYHNLV